MQGNEYRVSHLDGASLFKDFVLNEQRPNVTFYQGDYTTQISTVEVDKPIVKEPHHFVVSRSIASADPNTAFHDTIVDASPIEYWSLDQKVFDEATGELISEISLPADGEIVLTDLEYYNSCLLYTSPSPRDA